MILNYFALPLTFRNDACMIKVHVYIPNEIVAKTKVPYYLDCFLICKICVEFKKDN